MAEVNQYQHFHAVEVAAREPFARAAGRISRRVQSAASSTVQSNPDITPAQQRFADDQAALDKMDPWRDTRNVVMKKDPRTGIITAHPRGNGQQNAAPGAGEQQPEQPQADHGPASVADGKLRVRKLRTFRRPTSLASWSATRSRNRARRMRPRAPRGLFARPAGRFCAAGRHRSGSGIPKVPSVVRCSVRQNSGRRERQARPGPVFQHDGPLRRAPIERATQVQRARKAEIGKLGATGARALMP